MAWEEESIDTGGDAYETSSKKNKLKLILIAVGALLVLGGGGFAAYTFFLKDKPEDKPKAEEAKPEEVIPEVGFKVNLEKFQLNLADKGEPRYVVVTLALEVSTLELQTKLTDEADTMLYKAKTRDVIIGILRSKTAKEINDPTSSKEISKEVEFKLNRLYKEGKVIGVYVTDIMVQ